MVTDSILAPLLALLERLIGLLPVGVPPVLPSIDPLWDAIAGIDSLIPIVEPLVFMLGLLSAAVVFITVRLVLTAWNLIWP